MFLTWPGADVGEQIERDLARRRIEHELVLLGFEDRGPWLAASTSALRFLLIEVLAWFNGWLCLGRESRQPVD